MGGLLVDRQVAKPRDLEPGARDVIFPCLHLLCLPDPRPGRSQRRPAGTAPTSGGGAGWAGPARRYLESVVEWLDGPEAIGAGHGELEARLQVHSREQYRLLLQGHLDERARLEKRRSGVTGSDGVSRPRVENGHRRGLTTVFGPVTVTRKAYRAVPGTAADAGTAAPAGLPVRPPRARCPGRGDLGPDAGGHRHDNGARRRARRRARRDNRTGATSTGVGNADAESASGRCGAEPAVGRHSAGLQRLAAVEAARGSFADARAAGRSRQVGKVDRGRRFPDPALDVVRRVDLHPPALPPLPTRRSIRRWLAGRT